MKKEQHVLRVTKRHALDQVCPTAMAITNSNNIKNIIHWSDVDRPQQHAKIN